MRLFYKTLTLLLQRADHIQAKVLLDWNSLQAGIVGAKYPQNTPNFKELLSNGHQNHFFVSFTYLRKIFKENMEQFDTIRRTVANATLAFQDTH